MKNYLTSPEVAEQLDIAEMTVSRWRKTGVGPEWIKIGGRYRYPRDRFEQWVAENMTVTA